MRLIERAYYPDKLKDVMVAPDIRVIAGVRRGGKSKLPEAFIKIADVADWLPALSPM